MLTKYIIKTGLSVLYKDEGVYIIAGYNFDAGWAEIHPVDSYDTIKVSITDLELI